MTVFCFKPRFHPQIQAGTKVNTIRADRKRPVKVGEALSLRGWSGRPYCSPQVVVLDGQRCIRTCPVVVHVSGYEIAGVFYGEQAEIDAFAVRDGFKNWIELVIYFRDNGGLPFRGTLIGWAP